MTEFQQNLYDQADSILRQAESEQRGFTDAESSEFEELKHQLELSIEDKAMPNKTIPAPQIVTSKNKADESYSLQRMMSDVANQRGISGVEAEVDQELKHQQPWRDVGGVLVPMENIFLSSAKRKALAATVQKASGVIGATNLLPLVGVGHHDELFTLIDTAIGDELLVGKLGGRTLTGLVEKTERIPRQTSPMSAGHVAIDSDLPTSSDPAFSNYDMEPHLVGSVTELKLSNFMATHPGAHEDFFAAELRRALVQEIDRVTLLGDSGVTAAEPDGVLTLATDSTENIVHDSTAQDSLIVIVKVLRDYLNEAKPNARWVMDADVLDSFRTIAAFASQTGARSLLAEAGLDANVLLGYGVVPTTKFEVNTTPTPDTVDGLFGDFSTLISAFWSGVDVSINPYADSVFSSGSVLIRAMMLHDVGVVDPKRIIKYTADLQTG